MNVDFNHDPWSSACLITWRHGVHLEWNEAAIQKMCQSNGECVFVCTAEDTINGRSLMMQEKCTLESKGRGNRLFTGRSGPGTVNFASPGPGS